MSAKRPTDGPIFPIETFREILFHADEATLWRLRSCSQTLLELADVELVPFLAEKTLEVEPTLVSDDNYPSAYIPSPETDTARRDALITASDRLAAHFDAYPPSADHLRKFTVEVRDDNASAGWTHLKRCARTIEHLAIRVVHATSPPYDAPKLLTSDGLWLAAFGEIHLSSIYLSSLVSVHLHAPNRLLDHARILLHCAPNLRSLSLSSPTEDGAEARAFGRPLRQLECVSFRGTGQMLVDLAKQLALCRVRASVTLDLIPGSYDMENTLGVLRWLSCPPAWNLCLYGPCGADLLQAAVDGRGSGWCDYITTLAVEQLQDRQGEPRRFSLLSPGLYKPDLPAIKRLIIIDRSSTPESHEDSTLEGLFIRYSTLDQLLLIAGSPLYPADPFADVPPSSWAEHNIVCCAERQEDGSVQITRPAAAI